MGTQCCREADNTQDVYPKDPRNVKPVKKPISLRSPKITIENGRRKKVEPVHGKGLVITEQISEASDSKKSNNSLL